MKTTLKRLLCLVLSVMFFTMSLPVLAADVADEPTTTATETKYPLENPDYKIYTKADLLEFAGAVKNAKGKKVTAQLFANIDLLKDIETTRPSKTHENTEEYGKALKTKKDSTYEQYLEDGEYFRKGTITEYTDKLNSSYTLSVSGDKVIVILNETTTLIKATTKIVQFGDKYKGTITWNTKSSLTVTDTELGNTVPTATNLKIATIDIATGTVTAVDGQEDRVATFEASAVWTPIGQSAAGENDGFCGVFDAFQYNEKGEIVGEYSISGIYINGEENEVGLFGHVGHAEIRGVKVENSYIRGYEKVGAIAGFAHHEASFVGCWNANTSVVFGENYVGGIVGLSNGAAIYGCSNYADVEATGNYVGGIAGHLAGENAYLREVVNGATATVTGKEYVGGIVGYLGETENNPAKDADGTTVTAALELFMAYNHGTVNGTDEVGGLVGYNATRGKVFNSYSSGPVLVTNTDATSKNASNGNIVGFNEGEVRDCFYYPKKNAEVANAIGNGIGNASTGTKSHVIGFVPKFMETEAAAYLLNLVYLGEAEGEGTDVHEVGYHHMATHDFDDANWENPTYWMAGENGPEFTEDSKLAPKTIKSASVRLKENFNIKFKVDVPAGLPETVIGERSVVVYQEGMETPLSANQFKDTQFMTDPKTGELYYEFTLTDIKPQYITDKMEVVFTANYTLPVDVTESGEIVQGEEVYLVSEKVEYGIKDYCERQLERDRTYFANYSDEDYQKLTTLLCNILEYGARYQEYRNYKLDNLATSVFTTNEKIKDKIANGTIKSVKYHGSEVNDEVPAATRTYTVKVPEGRNPDFYIYSDMVRFGSENSLGLFLHINEEKYNKEWFDDNSNLVIATIQYPGSQTPVEVRVGELEKHSSMANTYKLVGKAVSITEYETPTTFDLYPPVQDEAGNWINNEDSFETMTNSMEAFVTSLLNINDSRKSVVRALWDYYYAAKLYSGVNVPVGGR